MPGISTTVPVPMIIRDKTSPGAGGRGGFDSSYFMVGGMSPLYMVVGYGSTVNGSVGGGGVSGPRWTVSLPC